LAELITELLEFERNTYWRTGRDWSATVGGTDLLAVLLREFALRVVQFCQMQAGLIYVYTNSVIDCV